MTLSRILFLIEVSRLTREEIMAVRKVLKQIRKQEEYLAGLKALKVSMERQVSRGHSGTPSSKIEGLIVKIMMAEGKLAQLQARRFQEQELLTEKILEQDYSALIQAMLIYRYAECLTWTEISEIMQMGRRRLYELNKKFIAHLDAHFDC